MTISRRVLLATGAAALAGCGTPPHLEQVTRAEPVELPPPPPPMPARYGAISDEPYYIPAVPDGVVPPELWRQEVANPYPDMRPGGVVIDPDDAYLHLVEEGGRALRYGISVGRAGFGWSGDAVAQWKREWPPWKVPDEMAERQPELAPYTVSNGGMDPGPGNPLGARAIYLFQNGEDTLYRIHGGCEPAYLGKAVSSGCIRMLDQDAIDLFDRIGTGVPVRVLRSVRPAKFATIY